MKNHLTEKELIEYQFKLASEARAEEIAEHLKDCARCREGLEGLKRKFAALDLLRDETKVSEDLISQVIAQAEKPTQAKIVSFRKPAWITAVAAVLLLGLLLLVPHLTRQEVQTREVAQDLARPAEDFGKKDTMEKFALDLAEEKPAVVAAAKVAEKLVPDKPPFAPASAIELVVLPRREKVQITIYNSADLTLVRERRNLTLKKGWNWLQFMWANTLIDPTSLSLEPLARTDKIDIQQLVFPARLCELGRWLIRSQITGQVPFEITYFTSGLSWRAFYMGTLSADERKMELAGYVRLTNKSGEDYEKAQTRLIVGKVHILDQIAQLAKRTYPYNRPGEMWDFAEKYAEFEEEWEYYADEIRDRVTSDLKLLRPKEIRKEGLSEYFLYTIEGTETIPDKWGKRLLSFEAEDIEVKSLYKYDEQRWGNQAIRFVAFANDEEHNLGETPIPNGTVKIYSYYSAKQRFAAKYEQADERGHLSYVGGTNIKYIPVDEEVELNLGPARLVSVEPILMNFETDNFLYDRNKDIAGWDEIRTWKIEVTNTRTLPVEIEITRGFDTAYWTLQLDGRDVSYKKHDATHARFKLEIEPRTKRKFNYTVTTYHGLRQEALTE